MHISPLIALLTDFGTADPFVGVMKGVIAQIAPDCTVIDITHEIPPGDIRKGAITLWQAVPYFPEGTIFLCVVDPGVGTSRRSIIVASQGKLYIGPDNGLFTFVSRLNYEAWEIQNPAYILQKPGKTFHGRDIFAPAAAHLARRVPIPEFGTQVTNLTRISRPLLENPRPGVLRGETLYPDRFGNMLTSLGQFECLDDQSLFFHPWLPEVPGGEYPIRNMRLRLPNDILLPWVTTFEEIQPGTCAFLVGSSGLLEIVSDRISATKMLGLTGGEILTLLCGER